MKSVVDIYAHQTLLNTPPPNPGVWFTLEDLRTMMVLFCF